MYENDLNHIEFIIYCIETYKGQKKIDGKSVYQKFCEKGVIEYIDENYNALHTFGDEHIVWNIDEYLKNH